MDALLVTGTRASGKSTVVRAVVEMDSRFALVPAVTTRPHRDDDAPGQYEHMSTDDFRAAVAAGELLVQTDYGDASYGIRRTAFENVIAQGKVPIAVLTPDATARLQDSVAPGERPLSVFLDALDAELDRRLAERGGGRLHETNMEQRSRDRASGRSSTYRLINERIEDTAKTVIALWQFRNKSGVVPGRMIRHLLACDALLRHGDEAHAKEASYDLRLGDEYYASDGIKLLSEANPFLTIEPYDFAIVTTREECRMPNDITGRFDLAVRLFQQGVILSNSTQVDPGFEGPLFCLLFNTSSSRVRLKRGHHFATIEFHKLAEAVLPYDDKYQGKSLVDYIPEYAVAGAIHELKETVDELESQSRFMQELVWSLIALFVAIMTVFLALRI